MCEPNSGVNENMWTITYSPWGSTNNQIFKICHADLIKTPGCCDQYVHGRFFHRGASEFSTPEYTFKKELSTWKLKNALVCYICKKTSNLWRYTYPKLETKELTTKILCNLHLRDDFIIKDIQSLGLCPTISFSDDNYGIAPLEETWELGSKET